MLGVLAEDAHLSGAALAVALEDLHRRRLAGAVGAEEGEDFPPPHLEVDAAHRLDLAIALAQAADGDDGVGQSPAIYVEVAVLDPHYDALTSLQRPPDAVGDGHRAMPAAGAADGDRQVALALGDVGGDEELEQRQQPAVELARLRARLDVGAHRLVEAGLRSQLVDVVGVGQEADVEGEVGVARRAVLEAEGEQGQRQLAAVLTAQHLLGDPPAQLPAGQAAGVHHHVGAGAQRREQLALGADPVDDPALRGERMAAARLLVAVEQRLLVGLEEEQLRLQPVGAELVEHLDQPLEVLAAAHVGDDGGLLHPAALVAEELAEAADHPRRQVVDAEVAAVLEGGDRFRLAGAGVAGDQDQLDLAAHG